MWTLLHRALQTLRTQTTVSLVGYFAFRLLVQYFFSRSEIAFQEQGVKELLKLVVSITLAGVILWLGGSM